MNGKSRDELRSDLVAGRPSLSKSTDELALRVARLLSSTDAERLWDELETRVRRSPAYLDWLHKPSTYLAELDPGVVKPLETYLATRLDRARAEAHERGWEIDGD